MKAVLHIPQPSNAGQIDQQKNHTFFPKRLLCKTGTYCIASYRRRSIGMDTPAFHFPATHNLVMRHKPLWPGDCNKAEHVIVYVSVTQSHVKGNYSTTPSLHTSQLIFSLTPLLSTLVSRLDTERHTHRLILACNTFG